MAHSPAAASPLRVLSSNGLHAALLELGPQFERSNGCRLELSFDSTNALAERIRRGERGDVVILTVPVMDALAGEGITQAARVLARSGAGIAVRAGAPKPEIGSVDAFRAALLACRSIVYTRLGASGIYFAGLIDRLGIGAQIRAKATVPDGGLVGEFVAAGQAEIAVQQIPELVAVRGVELVGPFPEELQVYTVLAAAPFADAPQAAAARAFVDFLAAPAALEQYRRNGMEAAR